MLLMTSSNLAASLPLYIHTPSTHPPYPPAPYPLLCTSATHKWICTWAFVLLTWAPELLTEQVPPCVGQWRCHNENWLQFCSIILSIPVFFIYLFIYLYLYFNFLSSLVSLFSISCGGRALIVQVMTKCSISSKTMWSPLLWVHTSILLLLLVEPILPHYTQLKVCNFTVAPWSSYY